MLESPFSTQNPCNCIAPEIDWARFGDAVSAAGFEPNKFLTVYPDEFLIVKLFTILSKLSKRYVMSSFSIVNAGSKRNTLPAE